MTIQELKDKVIELFQKSNSKLLTKKEEEIATTFGSLVIKEALNKEDALPQFILTGILEMLVPKTTKVLEDALSNEYAITGTIIEIQEEEGTLTLQTSKNSKLLILIPYGLAKKHKSTLIDTQAKIIVKMFIDEDGFCFIRAKSIISKVDSNEIEKESTNLEA